eukprot:m.181087 g.181087  ORF g.181087 m.181087 type:complete len:517 (-) comp15165_c0_seq1:60-1610(-)
MGNQDESAPLMGGGGSSNTNGESSLGSDVIVSLMSFQTAVIILLGLFTTYKTGNPQGVGSEYSMMLNVSVMIFIGFGYLMTFLKKYGYGAVGFTFCVSAVTIEWTILNIGFWGCVEGENNPWGVNCSMAASTHHRLPQFGIGIDMIVQGLFGAAAVMISFGALIGKASFDQMVFLAIVESMVYAVNAYIYFVKIGALDTGGSVVIHIFGAYFGLAATAFLTPRDKRRDFSDMSSSYSSDVFAFIGTVFLWIYWPSFNGVKALPEFQERAIVNTTLSLLASCVTSFFCSRRFRGEGLFDAVDIQNATLAGGVAMGTAATLPLEPFGAMIGGALAGAISCGGYAFLLDILERKGVHDTCGINNLHGMPGLLGGLIGVLMTGVATASTASDLRFPHGRANQWWHQLVGLLITLVVALVTGAITGYVANKAIPRTYKVYYTDECHWTVPTGDLSFTKEDVKPEAPRRQSMRMRRSGLNNWTKVQNLVKATSLLRAASGMGGGGTLSAISEEQSINSDNDP